MQIPGNTRSRSAMTLMGLMWLGVSLPMQTVSAAGAQHSETDFQFLKELSARLDAAENEVKVFETEIEKLRSGPGRQSQGSVRLPSTNSRPEKNKTGTTEKRVSETLKHRERAVDADPDKLSRIKVKFGLLKQDITKARKDLLGHELSHVQQNREQKTRRTQPGKSEQKVIDIENRLKGLAEEVRMIKAER